MPTRTDESPIRQQDRADELAGRPRDEPRNSEQVEGQDRADSDAGVSWFDDPDINTHGSER